LSYDVELDVYTGPLDLLLELIERQDLDICDVALSKVTDGFISYMQTQDLSSTDMQAFLSIAAQLIKIKAYAVSGSLEVEPVSPGSESELAEQLQRYQILKQQSKALQLLAQNHKKGYTSAGQAVSSGYEHLIERLGNTLQKLADAKQSRQQFQLKLARNQPRLAKHRKQFQQLLLTLKRVQLTELIDSCDSHDQRVVYFICILESVRNQQLDLGYHNQAVFLEVVK
jgi:segregation and condensation protein A